MKCIPLVLVVLLLSSCELITDVFNPQSGSNEIIIGLFQDKPNVHQIYNPPLDLAGNYEKYSLDIEGDSIADFEVRILNSHHHGFTEFLATVEVINSDFRISTETLTDTVFACRYNTSDGVHTEYHYIRDSLNCPVDSHIYVDEVLKNEFANTHESGDTLSNDLYWKVLPQSDWNYGIKSFNLNKPNDAFDVNIDEEKLNQNFYWNLENAPVVLRTKAKKIPNWTTYNEMAGPLPFSGGSWPGEEYTIELIPYGCTTLRISQFPIVK